MRFRSLVARGANLPVCCSVPLLGLLLLIAAGCSPAEPLKIGFIGGVTGSVADLGTVGRDATQLAVELRNRAGGVSGRPVELLIKNDEQNPAVARRVVDELAAQGALAIVGPMTSAMAEAVLPLVNRRQILMVSPTSTAESLSGQDDHFFRVTSTTRIFASGNADYQLKHGRMRRVAAVYDEGNRNFSENWLANFEAAFREGGGEVAARIGFVSGSDIIYMDLARELLAAGADGLLIIANSVDSALLCQQVRKLNAAIPITLADWGATERLVELGGRAVEGVTVVQTFDRHSTAPRYLEFRDAFLERFHREPGFAGVYAFDAANVVLEALEKRPPGKSLKETVLAIREFTGLQSPFQFDDCGDVQRPHVSISVVRDGKFTVLERR